VKETVTKESVEVDAFRESLDEIARQGAQRMLQAALEAEVDSFLEEMQSDRDEEGRRQVVRNGRLPKREVVTGVGLLDVEQPRVRDRRGSGDPESVRFTSKILPPYLRKSRNVEELIPFLYLKGISTGDFASALEPLLGPNVAGLSATTVTRLTSQWVEEQKEWSRRDLSDRRYVYLWADGIYFNVRLDSGDRQCILVVMGALPDGTKELVAIHDGFREDKQSWLEILLELKARGLSHSPQLAIGDGALGFWAALREAFPDTAEQRCWVHKTANVLAKLPKSVQPRAKEDLHEIWQAPTRKDAQDAFDLFVAKYEAKYERAAKCLAKDREAMLTFYDFPAEHWKHLRTTNPIESTFATVRLRHRRTKGSGSRSACLAMVFKLVETAQQSWRKLNGYKLVLEVLEGRRFEDGQIIEKDAA
jgi:transposase-like protein